jgi:hypothetical protein
MSLESSEISAGHFPVQLMEGSESKVLVNELTSQVHFGAELYGQALHNRYQI